MKEQIYRNCVQFIENRNRIQSVFSWDSRLITLSCAGIFSSKGQTVDALMLKDCRDLLKLRVSAFSNFRGNARSPVAAMLATSNHPQRTLENGLMVYQMLKNDFWSSSYLPLAAMIIAQVAEPFRYAAIASRTRLIYNRMKNAHPFLTSGEDSVFCALMALSEKTDDMLIADAERCYSFLKQQFFSSNAVQSLSHVLALFDGESMEKCRKTMELFAMLKAAGYKYGTEYELPTLGVLAMSGRHPQEVVQEMIDIDRWLSWQQGFGLFSGITRKQRLMYAGILAQREYMQEETMQTAAVNGTISMIIAQQAAMCAAIAASSAAAASASSAN